MTSKNQVTDHKIVIEESSKSKKTNFFRQLIDKFDEWCETTTAHGIPAVIKRKNLFSKILWLIFTATSIGLCIFMIQKTVNEYLKFEVTTKIREELKPSIQFPAITICNSNPMVTKHASEYIKSYFNYIYDLNVTYYEELIEQLPENATYNNDLAWLLYQTFMPQFDENLKKSFGYKSVELIQFAAFNNIPKDIESSFDWYYHNIYGNCFVFNLDGTTTQSFQGFGLELQLFAGLPYSLHDYFYESTGRGLAILIEDQQKRHLLEDGISIRPGTYTKIVINRKESEILSSPYSDCLDSDQIDTLISREMKKLNMPYDRRNCFELAALKKQIDEIGCSDAKFPIILNATPCSTYEDYEQLISMQIYLTDLTEYCPFECHLVNYEFTISYLDYPSYSYFLNDVYRYFDSFYELFGTNEISFDMYKESMANVLIQVNDLKITKISESPTITIPDLLANLGGTLGLFIGVSILSFVEVIELIIEILKILFLKIFRNK